MNITNKQSPRKEVWDMFGHLISDKNNAYLSGSINYDRLNSHIKIICDKLDELNEQIKQLKHNK